MVPAAEEVVMILTISAGRENIYSSLFSLLQSPHEEREVTDPLFHSQLGDLTRSRRTHNITIKITIKIPHRTYINKWPIFGLTLTKWPNRRRCTFIIYI